MLIHLEEKGERFHNQCVSTVVFFFFFPETEVTGSFLLQKTGGRSFDFLG